MSEDFKNIFERKYFLTTTSRLVAKKNNCYISEGRIMRKIFNFD